MAKIHILDQTDVNVYRAVAHFAMPTGNNAVGTPWKTCYLASFGAGTPVSQLPVGSGVGKIGQSESNSITTGDLIEIPFSFGDDPALNTTDRQTLMNMLADRAIGEFQASFVPRFKYYGYTQG